MGKKRSCQTFYLVSGAGAGGRQLEIGTLIFLKTLELSLYEIVLLKYCFFVNFVSIEFEISSIQLQIIS